MIRFMISADDLVAEEQGKLDPQAPAYVTRRRAQVQPSEADVPRPHSPSRSDEDVKDANIMV